MEKKHSGSELKRFATSMLVGFPVAGMGMSLGVLTAGIVSLAFPAAFPVLSRVLGFAGMVAGSVVGTGLGTDIYDNVIAPIDDETAKQNERVIAEHDATLRMVGQISDASKAGDAEMVERLAAEMKRVLDKSPSSEETHNIQRWLQEMQDASKSLASTQGELAALQGQLAYADKQSELRQRI